MAQILDEKFIEYNRQQILDHPPSLFVLFFTEMWERFSYYGMRALLVLFLTTSILGDPEKGYGPGWGWDRADALKLYAMYTGFVYLTPILGGLIADKILGYRYAVALGALVMTLGHVFMAIETEMFVYLGLIALVLGNGLFKPNISSIVGQLYDSQEKKDAAYTIFYMGINAGAFLGIMLCGYIGETVGWSYGFGLAGIFMFFGMLQFWFAQNILGKIGLRPTGTFDLSDTDQSEKDDTPANVVRDRLAVIGIFAFFTIFFWWAFEQAGGSMTIFAADYTDRSLEGNGAMIFKIFNSILTIFPMIVITWVLLKLFKVTFANFATSNSFLALSFVIIWAIVLWMLFTEFSSSETEVKASWFGILNSFFIIAFAPLFSKFWEAKIITSGPIKFALGLILLGLGFGILAYGSSSIPQGAKVASVSLIWLVLAYLFHTLGELCLSPVGLSYVSKLAPARLVGLMFGIWFASSAVANFAGGITGSYIDQITEAYSMSVFFLIFTLIPIGAGLILILLNGTLKRMMHGIE